MVWILTYRYTLTLCTHDSFIHATSSINAHISHLVHNDDDPCWRYRPSCAKCNKWHRWPWIFKIKTVHIHTTYYIPKVFWIRVMPFSGKGNIKITPKYQYACYLPVHPRGPNISPFHSTMGRFRVTPPFPGKVHLMTPNDLDMFKIKNINMHATYTSYAQIFRPFAVWWAISDLRPFFWKSAPNDPTWPWRVQGQNTNKHAKYPRCPNFRPFHSTMSRFQFTTQFWEKCTDDSQVTLSCSRSNVHICRLHTYIIEAQIFVRLALR